jgi:Flp pilus assembly protein TadD
MRRYVLLLCVLALAGCGGAQHITPQSNLLNEPHLGVAEAAAASGDYGMAESILARAADAAPSDATLQLRYADVLLKQNKITQAHDLLAKRIGRVSDPQMLHGALGALDVLQGEPAQAIAEFDAVRGDDSRWTLNKAVALDILGRHDEAQVLYRRALASQPDDSVVINDLALSLMLSGRKADAASVLAPLASRTDLTPRIQGVMGVLRAANGDLAGAHQVIGTAIGDDQLLRLANALNKTTVN